jgi:DNA-directed RNA polymerase specialized sigma subunit
MTNKIKDTNNVLHYLLMTHAPLIQRQLKSLRASNKLPPEHEVDDTEFHEPAMQGLMEAVVKYKPEVGPFANYASQMIRGRIQNHADNMYAIPKHIRTQAKQFSQMQSRAESQVVPKPASGQSVKTDEHLETNTDNPLKD